MKTTEEFDVYLQSFEDKIEGDKLVAGSCTGLVKGLVYYLHKKFKVKKDFITRLIQIAAESGIVDKDYVKRDALDRSTQKLVKEIKEKRRANLKRDGHLVMRLLNEEFRIPCSSHLVSSTDFPGTSARELFPSPLATLSAEKRKYPSTPIVSEPSPKKLKSDCSKCKYRRKAINQLTLKKKQLKKNLDDSFLSSYNTSALKRALKRKGTIELNLRKEQRKLKSDLVLKNSVIRNLERKLAKKTKEKKKKHKCKHESKLASVEKELASLKKLQNQLELEIEGLRAIVFDEQSGLKMVSVKKDKKSFNSGYRKAAYTCLINQVPVDTTGSVISTVVKEVTGLTIEDGCADPSTVSQFAYELGVLNDIQVGETLVKEININLAWDATSLDAEHVNEVHVNLAGNRSLVLQIDILPGGTAADYVEHICRCLGEITDTYALFSKMDSIELHKSINKKLKSTLSDRVIVNHCVRVQLEKTLEIELLELKCNAHPLDGLASQARKTLREMDKASGFSGTVFGRECAVVNVIYELSKMRYKNGSGDPKGFKTFMAQNNIQSKMVPRYVGNRMHILFHLAGTFYSILDKLLNYLQKFCNCNTPFRTALFKDLSKLTIQLQLKALGILGKILTGPWMTTLYGNKDNLTNLETVPILQKCVKQLKFLQEHPLAVLELKEDMFGMQLSPDEDCILASLQRPVVEDLTSQFTAVLQDLLTGSILVLERQLQEYLKGNLSAPTEEMLAMTKSAPTHNIVSEQVLGMTDHQYHRAPNATMGFIDGKVRSAKNKTLGWLNSKTIEEQHRLISFAVSRARKVRTTRKRREDHVDCVYRERQKQKIQKKDQTFRGKVEKKVKLAMSDPSVDLGQELNNLFEIPDSKLKTINQTIRNQETLVNKCIDHFWNDKGIDIQYHGRILKVKQTQSKKTVPKPATAVVAYWTNDKIEADATDSKILVSQIMTDYILDDLFFLD